MRKSLKLNFPKFIISKPQGRNLDWLRCWSQFETEQETLRVVTMAMICSTLASL